MTKHPKATLIIPSHQIERNREGNLIALLSQLSRVLNPDDYQVIVVCNNTNVAKALGMGQHTDVSMIPDTRFLLVNLVANYGLVYAWNRGLEYATGDYVFFVSHDVILTREENIFEKMIKEKEAFEARTGRTAFLFGVEGARHTPNPTVRMIQRFQVGQFSDTIQVDDVSGFLFGIKSTLLYPGFFDENLSPCFYEEMDLCQQLRSQNKSLKFLGIEPMVNIIIPDIGYKHEYGVSSSDPKDTFLLWVNAKDKQTYRESLWNINRRNRLYIMRKWGINIA